MLGWNMYRKNKNHTWKVNVRAVQSFRVGTISLLAQELKIGKENNLGDDKFELSPINIAEINLYPEMNANIPSLLKIRDTDIVSMYAAKLIESLQEEVRDLKARLASLRAITGLSKENKIE